MDNKEEENKQKKKTFEDFKERFDNDTQFNAGVKLGAYFAFLIITALILRMMISCTPQRTDNPSSVITKPTPGIPLKDLTYNDMLKNIRNSTKVTITSEGNNNYKMSLTIDGETMRGIIEKGEEVINFEVRDQKIYEITRDGDVLNLNLLDAYDFLFMYPKSTVTYFLKLQNIKLEEDNVVKYRYTNVTAGTSLYEYVDVYIKDYKVEKMVSESAGTTTVVTYE